MSKIRLENPSLFIDIPIHSNILLNDITKKITYFYPEDLMTGYLEEDYPETHYIGDEYETN